MWVTGAGPAWGRKMHVSAQYKAAFSLPHACPTHVPREFHAPHLPLPRPGSNEQTSVQPRATERGNEKPWDNWLLSSNMCTSFTGQMQWIHLVLFQRKNCGPIHVQTRAFKKIQLLFVQVQWSCNTITSFILTSPSVLSLPLCWWENQGHDRQMIGSRTLRLGSNAGLIAQAFDESI